MKITVALCWYDESVPFLARCVESLAGIADQLVAYDGAWQHYPDPKPRSPIEQAWEIARSAGSVGIPYEIVTGKVWESQVAKRAALMDEARQRGDWVLVIDGDEWVEQAKAFEFRAALDSYPGDVAMVGAVALQHNPEMTDWRPHPIRRVYRAATGVTVTMAHNGYVTRDGRWLHGDPCYVPLEDALDLSHLLVLHHERGNRGEARDAARLAYRRARRDQGLEEWRRAA